MVRVFYERDLTTMPNPDSYLVSRTNAVKWGTWIDGPIPCVGRDRCTYKEDCVRQYPHMTLPPPGTLCLPELLSAHEAYRTLRKQWLPLVDHLHTELDELIARTVSIVLRRTRTMTRQNRAWEYMTDDPDDLELAEHEFDLTSRYLTAISHEYDDVLAEIDAAIEARLYANWWQGQHALGLFKMVDGRPQPLSEYPGPDHASGID